MNSLHAKDPVQEILGRLEGVKQTGEGQYMARCPAHDDRHASLSVGRGDDGRALIDCKAGCTTDEVVKALGKTVSDLFATPSFSPTKKAKPKAAKKSRTIYKTAEEAFAAVERMAKGKFVTAWIYPGDTFRVARFAQVDGEKTFRPIYRNGEGWSIGDPVGALPLYRGDKIGDAEAVVVAEGEKCADAAASVGLVTVTSAHGGGSAHKSDWGILSGREWANVEKMTMSNPISSPSKILIEPGKQLPIVDGYDVVVVGGGIAGITAAVAAARNGARTLLAEKNYALGGLATLGNVIVYLPLCDGIPSYAALSPFVRAAGGCSQLARNATGLIEREIASWQTVLFAP